MANAVSTDARVKSFATSAEEGEVWLGMRGCRVVVRGGAVVDTHLLEGGALYRGDAKAGPALQQALDELSEYMQGKRRHFGIRLFVEGPPFYRQVWETLRKVPYGKTISYGELAALAGRPGSARAVGSAMRRNPVPLIVPCHRVVGSGGKLGGFSYGTSWKKFLLDLEGKASSLEFKL